MHKALLLVISALVLASCSTKLKQKVGLVTPGPDEYKVQRTKSLEVPPHFYLPEPADSNIPKQVDSTSKNLNEGEKALIDEIGK